MKFKDYIAESFDTKPASFRITRNNRFGVDYEFRIDDIIYNVEFFIKTNGADVLFSAKADNPTALPTIELTGTGNQFKVLITVIEIIKQFIIESASAVITFSAAKSEIVGDARPNVYRRLIKREIAKLSGDWSFKEKDTGRQIKFALVNNDEI